VNRSKLVKAIGLSMHEYDHIYSKIIGRKYIKTIRAILFEGRPYHHNKKFSAQLIRHHLKKLYKLKHRREYVYRD